VNRTSPEWALRFTTKPTRPQKIAAASSVLSDLLRVVVVLIIGFFGLGFAGLGYGLRVWVMVRGQNKLVSKIEFGNKGFVGK
jgi:hypothetical protein